MRKAKAYMKTRVPLLPSKYFIQNYLSSFLEDPIVEEAKALNANVHEEEAVDDTNSGHYLKALEAFNAGNHEEVLTQCNMELKGYDSPSGEGDESVQEKKEEVAKALLLRGTWLFLMGDGAKALKDFTACIEHPDANLKVKVNALIKRACQHLQDEDVESCFADFDRALKLDPSNGDVFHHRGQVMMLLEKYDKAVSDFDKAAALHPSFPPTQIQKRLVEYRRAFREQNLEKVSACAARFRETVDKFPSSSDGCSIFGQILADLNEYQQAEEYMERAHKLNPEDAMILVHRGLIKVQTNNTDEAVKYMKMALEIDPKCEFAYETWATLEVQSVCQNGVCRSIACPK
ncbi:unnamed protein product [Notodromas monacha]|uniref:Mitochondrial import receptor subunit TOM70 n=1 Tax=Notodromas monacha TaxID=399045 RepID=A0A7R9GIF5_9CRUS|nr:unnamed protein product [Notodromas monacha]CAG0923906.1 unnamed protein product [Notodromas monacha]